jgi:hypothetical protein
VARFVLHLADALAGEDDGRGFLEAGGVWEAHAEEVAAFEKVTHAAELQHEKAHHDEPYGEEQPDEQLGFFVAFFHGGGEFKVSGLKFQVGIRSPLQRGR